MQDPNGRIDEHIDWTVTPSPSYGVTLSIVSGTRTLVGLPRECNDGTDGDGTIDFDEGGLANHGVALGPPDADCASRPYDTTELTSTACGLGAEPSLMVPPLMGLTGRRRRNHA